MSVTISDGDGDTYTRDSVLEALGWTAANVLGIEPREDGSFSVSALDVHGGAYVAAVLTRDQMLALADELRNLTMT